MKSDLFAQITQLASEIEASGLRGYARRLRTIRTKLKLKLKPLRKPRKRRVIDAGPFGYDCGIQT